MLLFSAACVAALAISLPAQTPADTLRLAVAPDGTAFAWGVVQLRNGARLRAYLPASPAGPSYYFTLPYYLAPPDQGSPLPRPKRLSLRKIHWMLVRGQYSEALPTAPTQHASGRLATRLVAGPVELFVVKMQSVPVSFLSSAPVLSAPVSTTEQLSGAASYYLRRPGQPALLLEPSEFASQVSAFLADDAELARRIQAGQAGYRLAELPSLVQQYNQRPLH